MLPRLSVTLFYFFIFLISSTAPSLFHNTEKKITSRYPHHYSSTDSSIQSDFQSVWQKMSRDSGTTRNEKVWKIPV